MDQFRLQQQHTTRLRPTQRDSEERAYSGSAPVEARTRQEDPNAYDSFEDRRRSYEDPYHRTRGNLSVTSQVLCGTLLTS